MTSTICRKEEDEPREKVLSEMGLRVRYLQEKVEKAVQRSEEKYCAVYATLRDVIEIAHDIEVTET